MMYIIDIDKSVLEILRRNFVKFRKRQRTEEMHGTGGWELRSVERRERCARGLRERSTGGWWWRFEIRGGGGSGGKYHVARRIWRVSFPEQSGFHLAPSDERERREGGIRFSRGADIYSTRERARQCAYIDNARIPRGASSIGCLGKRAEKN